MVILHKTNVTNDLNTSW